MDGEELVETHGHLSVIQYLKEQCDLQSQRIRESTENLVAAYEDEIRKRKAALEDEVRILLAAQLEAERSN